MISDFDLARKLFPRPAEVVRAAGADVPRTSQVHGRATSDSDGGTVTVVLDTEAGGEYAEMEVPTLGGITEGADVLVTMLDGTPVDCSQVGSIDGANAAAEAAQQVAEATGQHFWSDDDGIHVTEATREEWAESEGGANVLINSIGQLFRNGLNNLLSITTQDGARALTIWDGLGNAAENVRAIIGKVITLGKPDESHAEIDYHSLRLIDREGTEYLHVSDLCDESGYATLVDHFAASGRVYETTVRIASVLSVTVNGADVGYTFTEGDNYITLDEAPAEWSTVELRYTTASIAAKAYTFGTRKDGTDIGAMSHAEGMYTTASGAYSHAEGHETSAGSFGAHSEGMYTTAGANSSHAEGRSTRANAPYSHAEGLNSKAGRYASHAEGSGSTASGNASHAEGSGSTASGNASHAQNMGTVAAGDGQTVIGRWNVPDEEGKYALIVGNGTDDANRHNALTVDWEGHVTGADSADGTFTKGTYCNAYNRASVWRQGHIGCLSVVLQTTSNTPRGWVNVGTISIHPKAEVRALCGNETGTFSVVNITTAGVVQLLQGSAGSMWSQINVVFPV